MQNHSLKCFQSCNKKAGSQNTSIVYRAHQVPEIVPPVMNIAYSATFHATKNFFHRKKFQ